MTIQIGVRSKSAMVNVNNTTKQTKWIDITSSGEDKTAIVSNINSITISKIRFRSDSDDNWVMDFRFFGTKGGTATQSFSLTDVIMNNDNYSFPCVAMVGAVEGWRGIRAAPSRLFR